jgi:hypothetical protein
MKMEKYVSKGILKEGNILNNKIVNIDTKFI